LWTGIHLNLSLPAESSAFRTAYYEGKAETVP